MLRLFLIEVLFQQLIQYYLHFVVLVLVLAQFNVQNKYVFTFNLADL